MCEIIHTAQDTDFNVVSNAFGGRECCFSIDSVVYKLLNESHCLKHTHNYEQYFLQPHNSCLVNHVYLT